MAFVSTLVSIGSLVLAAACGGVNTTQAPSPDVAPAVAQPAAIAQGEQQQEAPSSSAGVLRRFASQRLVVFPTQAVASADPLGWRAASGGERVLLASLDAGIEAAMGERGLGSTWVFPAALQRAARRNPTYVTDPASIRALDPVRVALRKPDDTFAEPFASQLRSLAGVSDARYAFIPLELRLEPAGTATAGRAVLQVAVVDARGSRVVWAGDVAGDVHQAYAPAVLASLARRVADLVVPRN